jgi:nucleotide-binding universal stress UspA family protein
MRRRAPSPRLKTGTAGDGPADTATVVIGLDGSSASCAAFCWACGEARRLGGRAVAVFTSPAADDRTEGLAAGMLREAAGLDLTFIHAPGDPVAGLLRIAAEVHADLIVVGVSAATPHRLAGSVGQRLAARRRESVIVVVPPAM